MSRRIKIMRCSSPGSLSSLAGHVLRVDPGARAAIAVLLSGLRSRSKSGLLPIAGPGGWEPGFSLRFPARATRSIREFNLRRLTMNRITLIGFLGSDATTLNTLNSSFTVLSLATKSSYKDKKTGEYKGSTEWHRCVVWGKLSDFAKTLTKGAHLAVEGELRSREREDRKTNAKLRVWEIRVSSILKLDRAEKATPEELEEEEVIPEETAV
jgi:single-strand DNA-binding protein